MKIDRSGIAKIETGIRHVLDYEVVTLSKVLGVEVGLKNGGFLPTIEGMTRFNFPGAEFCCMGASALIVFLKASMQIVRPPSCKSQDHP